MAVATANGHKAATILEVPPLITRSVRLHLAGDSPLICHKWSQKAIKEMEDKQQGKARPKKEPKNPEEEYRSSLYTMEKGYGFPSVAFKAAAVSAATQLTGLTKVFLRGAFHAIGELSPVVGEPRMRSDVVRVGMGVADIHYRGEFPVWGAAVDVRYNPRVITLEQIVHLFNQAGFSVGIGEWRPEKDGTFGMFHVERVEDLG